MHRSSVEPGLRPPPHGDPPRSEVQACPTTPSRRCRLPSIAAIQTPQRACGTEIGLENAVAEVAACQRDLARGNLLPGASSSAASLPGAQQLIVPSGVPRPCRRARWHGPAGEEDDDHPDEAGGHAGGEEHEQHRTPGEHRRRLFHTSFMLEAMAVSASTRWSTIIGTENTLTAKANAANRPPTAVPTTSIVHPYAVPKSTPTMRSSPGNGDTPKKRHRAARRHASTEA